jgi:hypothetical protein
MRNLLPRFPDQTVCAFLFFPIRVTCPTRHINDLITLIISCEECMSWSSSVCNFLHSPSLILLGSHYSHIGESPKPLQHYFLELDFCECERPYVEAHFFFKIYCTGSTYSMFEDKLKNCSRNRFEYIFIQQQKWNKSEYIYIQRQ